MNAEYRKLFLLMKYLVSELFIVENYLLLMKYTDKNKIKYMIDKNELKNKPIVSQCFETKMFINIMFINMVRYINTRRTI